MEARLWLPFLGTGCLTWIPVNMSLVNEDGQSLRCPSSSQIQSCMVISGQPCLKESICYFQLAYRYEPSKVTLRSCFWSLWCIINSLASCSNSVTFPWWARSDHSANKNMSVSQRKVGWKNVFLWRRLSGGASRRSVSLYCTAELVQGPIWNIMLALTLWRLSWSVDDKYS